MTTLEPESFRGVVFAIIGLAVLIRSIVLLITTIKTSLRRKKLLNQGIKISATITEIKTSGIRINQQVGYIITAKYQDYTFRSQNCFFQVKDYLDTGDQIDVYIEANNPQYYWVDVDTITQLPKRNSKVNPQTTPAS